MAKDLPAMGDSEISQVTQRYQFPPDSQEELQRRQRGSNLNAQIYIRFTIPLNASRIPLPWMQCKLVKGAEPLVANLVRVLGVVVSIAEEVRGQLVDCGAGVCEVEVTQEEREGKGRGVEDGT